MRYLLDTNILVYAYKNLGSCRRKLDAQEPQRICICPLNLYELSVGIAKSQQPQALQLFMNDMLQRYTQIAFDNGAASEAARVRGTLERLGTPIGPMDALFVGIALANDLTLVTRNTREFARVPNLAVEDWYE